ncbi:helix-turn-helix transcriptional regulator [Xanthomonas sacchari]|uniref:helix-turn-helix transcriptional regulator n=1 Tax=Xanthomonas sacchari TaxID=56458 RepID=UPI003B2245E7
MSNTQRLEIERLPSVLARVGRSRASLYRDIAAGIFPSPVKIGARAVGWDSRAVDRWIAARFETAEASSR